MSSFGSIGGLRNFTIFGKTSPYVNVEKPPGHSPLPQSWTSWFKSTITGSYFIFSPNLIWFVVSFLVYHIFPFKYEPCKDLQSIKVRQYFLQRFFIHLVVVGGYYSFWFASLYYKSCSRRKFRGQVKKDNSNFTTTYVTPPNYPSTKSMVHNIWYWMLGILQWTCWEVAVVHLYATNKIIIPNEADLYLVIGIAVVPIWRGFHFYFSHRFLHIRPIYRFVHSLHHRNVDIEPFAGLTMHPVEHLYYFACLAPTIWLGGSPFLLLWNGYHLLLSPAASHSGWEDHFQSDQFHYLHHAKFECNYGSASMPFDFTSNTFQDKLQPGTKSLQILEDKKNNHVSLHRTPLIEWKDVMPAKKVDMIYIISNVIIFYILFDRVAFNGDWSVPLSAHSMGILVGFGPVIVAVLLRWCVGDKFSIRWPFHKERIVGKFGLHLILGILLTCWPTFQLVELITR